MLRVIKLSDNKHPLYTSLKAAGYRDNVLSLSEIMAPEIEALEYPYRGKWCTLNTASKSHIHVWKAFVHHKATVDHIYYDELDLILLTHVEFMRFRCEIFPVCYNGDPIPPGPSILLVRTRWDWIPIITDWEYLASEMRKFYMCE